MVTPLLGVGGMENNEWVQSCSLGRWKHSGDEHIHKFVTVVTYGGGGRIGGLLNYNGKMMTIYELYNISNGL